MNQGRRLALTDKQFYIAIFVPVLFNSALFGLLIAFIKARFDALERRVDSASKRSST